MLNSFIAVLLTEIIFTANINQESEILEKELVIGTSVSMPVVGENIEVNILPKFAKSEKVLQVISPTGNLKKLELDCNFRVSWQAKRYGKYLLKYGDYSRMIWVVSRPVIFNWWTTEIHPKFITSSMLAEEDSAEYWKRRGITRLHWLGGEYLSREEHEAPFSKAEQWFDNWWSRLAEIANEPQQGVCIDEIYGTDERVDGIEIPKAVAALRQEAGKNFAIGVYYSGLTEQFSTGMWYLRHSDVFNLEESYWGTEDIYLKRWQDIALYRLQEHAVLVISPGFNQSKRVRGSLTPEELRKEFAMVRRVAPDAAGLGVFNAYKNPELEKLADELIEDFFLKPTIHLQPHNGNLLARNIGHEDADGFSIISLDSKGATIQNVSLTKLTPMQSQELEVPEKTTAVKVVVPQGLAQLYPEGIYQLPEVMNPLQVVKASVENMEILACPDGDFTFQAIFNKPLNPNCLRNSNITLQGVLSGIHDGQVNYDEETNELSISFRNLPADFYTLRLLSGKNNISDVEGLPLDGSNNGLLDALDHYAVHFQLDRNHEKPVLPLNIVD